MLQLGEHGIIVLLCAMNMLNYIDRGILPGAPETFQGFIKNTLGVQVTDESLYFGILASAFIASYTIFSMVFGYFSISKKPFNVIAFGMGVWTIAVFCCASAKYAESYWLLLFGRVLSGIGEASFQCTATPFINDHAPPEKRSLWMGVFLASISVGTACGYMYGSMMASTSVGWSAAFFLEGLIMVVLVLLMIYGVPSEYNQIPVKEQVALQSASAKFEMGAAEASMLEHQSPRSSFVEVNPEQQSFFREVASLFKNVTFSLVVVGHSAYNFTVAGMGVFCPILLIGLGFFEQETTSSMMFGGMVAFTGTVGTLLGGFVLDRVSSKGANSSTPMRTLKALEHMVIFMVLGFVLVLTAYLTLPSKLFFLSILALAFLCFFGLSPAECVAVIELFPPSRRGFAVAANSMMIHVFGDVPSPIILGWLKDRLAPKCGTVEIDDKMKLNPECEEDREGLKHVILFACLWMSWAVVLWILAYRRHRNSVKKMST